LYVNKERHFDIQYDELVAIVLKSVGAILYEIYVVFFQNEIRGGNNIT